MPDIEIACLQGADTVRIRNAERVAEGFFSLDPSSRGEGSFDAHSLTCAPDRVEPADLKALNTTMRARTPEEYWEDLLAAGDLPHIHALQSNWDLVLMPDDQWQQQEVEAKIAAALTGTFARGRQVSLTTKVLHLKRPRLFPVLDSLVLETLRAPIPSYLVAASRLERTLAVISHVRSEARRLQTELEAVQTYLGSRNPVIERPLARILDGLLWTANPRSLTFPLIALIANWREADQAAG
jgi:hypothetical protein